MTPESQNNSLLVNGSVNIFQRKQTHTIMGERRFLWSAPHSLLRNGVVNISAGVNQRATIEEAVFSVNASLRLYNDDLRQLREREN
jgi:hypothetical protein